MKKDFKYFENYLLFDSYSIIEDIYLDTNDKKNKYSYSTKSFLGRKLYIFYEDASRQSGEFKKLQAQKLAEQKVKPHQKISNTFIDNVINKNIYKKKTCVKIINIRMSKIITVCVNRLYIISDKT